VQVVVVIVLLEGKCRAMDAELLVDPMTGEYRYLVKFVLEA
jgi:hypothetical protein